MKRFMIIFVIMSTAFGWEKVFDFSTDHTKLQDIAELSDGTLIVMMATGGMLDSTRNALHIVGINEVGDSIWTRQFGRFGYGAGQAVGSVEPCDDTTFIATGCIGRSFDEMMTVNILLRMNQNGEILWSQIDTTDEDYGTHTDITYNGNIVSASYGWFAVFDASGGRIGYEPLQRMGDLRFRGFQDMKTVHFPPHGLVFAGHASIPAFDDYIGYMVYMNSDYDTVWSISHGATGSVSYDSDGLEGIEVVSYPQWGYPKGFIGVGGISNADTTHHAYIVRTDMEGNIVWIRVFGSSRRHISYRFYSIVWAGNEDIQTRFAIVGRKRYSPHSEAILFMISDTLDGDTLWTKSYVVAGSAYDAARKIIRCGDGGFLIGGYYDESADIEIGTWLCRVDSLGNDVPYSIDEPEAGLTQLPEEIQVTAYPNPFNSKVEISIPDDAIARIFDIRGNLIHVISDDKRAWNAEEQPSGIYLLKVSKGQQTSQTKLMLVR